jgi:hypothetical protein
LARADYGGPQESHFRKSLDPKSRPLLGMPNIRWDEAVEKSADAATALALR